MLALKQDQLERPRFIAFFLKRAASRTAVSVTATQNPQTPSVKDFVVLYSLLSNNKE